LEFGVQGVKSLVGAVLLHPLHFRHYYLWGGDSDFWFLVSVFGILVSGFWFWVSKFWFLLAQKVLQKAQKASLPSSLPANGFGVGVWHCF